MCIIKNVFNHLRSPSRWVSSQLYLDVNCTIHLGGGGGGAGHYKSLRIASYLPLPPHLTPRIMLIPTTTGRGAQESVCIHNFVKQFLEGGFLPIPVLSMSKGHTRVKRRGILQGSGHSKFTVGCWGFCLKSSLLNSLKCWWRFLLQCPIICDVMKLTD